MKKFRVIGSVITCVALLALAFWAGRVTLVPPAQEAQTTPDSVLVDVTEQEIGQVLTLSTTVTRDSSPLATNSLTGVVTQVAPSGEFSSGDLLYTVGDTPVFIAEGRMPFWRELAEGAKETDVEQFQRFLNTQGLQVAADGTFGPATTRAVAQWQKKKGMEETGIITMGQLVAAENLPATITLDSSIAWTGASLTGGEKIVSMASGTPSFHIEATPTQNDMIPTGAPVIVHNGEYEWEGITGQSKNTESGTSLITVTRTDGSLLCGDECASLPATGNVFLSTDIRIVAPHKGPVVPVSAISTHPDGRTTVMVANDGKTAERTVIVRTTAKGLAVVDGVAPGEKVRALASSVDGEKQ